MESSALEKIEGDILALADVVREGFGTLTGKVNELRQDVGELHLQVSDLSHRLGKVENSLEDLREEVFAIGEAVSIDAEKIIRHDVRIGRLEKTVYTA